MWYPGTKHILSLFTWMTLGTSGYMSLFSADIIHSLNQSNLQVVVQRSGGVIRLLS